MRMACQRLPKGKGCLPLKSLVLTRVVKHRLRAGKCSQQKGLKVLLGITPVKHLRLNLKLFHYTDHPLMSQQVEASDRA